MFAVGLRPPKVSRLAGGQGGENCWKRPDVCGGIETFSFSFYACASLPFCWKRPDVCGGIETEVSVPGGTLAERSWKRPDVCGGIETWNHSARIVFQFRWCWKRPDVCGGIETGDISRRLCARSPAFAVGKDLMFAVGLRQMGDEVLRPAFAMLEKT